MQYSPNITLFSLAILLTTASLADDQIFRCGDEYTNDAIKAQRLNCSLLDTNKPNVIYGTQVYPSRKTLSSRQSNLKSAHSSQQVTAILQRQRDEQRKKILETELQLAQRQLQQQVNAYNNAKPQELAGKTTTAQDLARRQTLHEDIRRTQEDVAAIKNELARLK